MRSYFTRGRLIFALAAAAIPPALNAAGTIIIFDNIPNQVLGVSPIQIVARASPTEAITLASQTPSVCTNSGTLVLLRSTGTCTIQATASGASNSPLSKSFTVSQAG